MTDQFETWIASDECYPVLIACARQTIRRAKSIGLLLDGINPADDKRPQSIVENAQVVAGQLWQYLRKHAAQLAEKGTVLLLTGDEADFMAYLSQGFISDCLDRRRIDNPFHAYYRHMRTVLSREKGIRYESRGTEGSYYACSSTVNLDDLPGQYQKLDFTGWDHPSIPYSQIHRSSEMVSIARHFWDESLRQFHAEYLLPIRELIRFVAFSYPLFSNMVTDAGAGTEEGDVPALEGMERLMSADMSEELWQRQLRQLELDVVDSQLDTLARDCVAELSHRQRLVLSLHDQDFTLEEIARQLGDKGPTNVHYHLKTARSVLRRRWSLWGPPTLRQFSEVDEEEFFLFYEKVISFCKDVAEGRE